MKYAPDNTHAPTTSQITSHHVVNAEADVHSRVQVLAPKLHTQDHMPVAIRKCKGIFRLHLGCADTQWTSSIVSVVPDGLG